MNIFLHIWKNAALDNMEQNDRYNWPWRKKDKFEL